MERETPTEAQLQEIYIFKGDFCTNNYTFPILVELCLVYDPSKPASGQSTRRFVPPTLLPAPRELAAPP